MRGPFQATSQDSCSGFFGWYWGRSYTPLWMKLGISSPALLDQLQALFHMFLVRFSGWGCGSYTHEMGFSLKSFFLWPWLKLTCSPSSLAEQCHWLCSSDIFACHILCLSWAKQLLGVLDSLSGRVEPGAALSSELWVSSPLWGRGKPGSKAGRVLWGSKSSRPIL